MKRKTSQDENEQTQTQNQSHSSPRISVVIVGDEFTGKTSLCLKHTRRTFPGSYVPTILESYPHLQDLTSLVSPSSPSSPSSWSSTSSPISSSSSSCFTSGPSLSLSTDLPSSLDLIISDTAGGDTGDAFERVDLYQTADVILLTFSLVEKESLYNIESKWLPEVREHCHPAIPLIIVGTKGDLGNTFPPSTCVPSERGILLSEEMRVSGYIETSAKNARNVRLVFMESARQGYIHYLEKKRRQHSTKKKNKNKKNNHVNNQSNSKTNNKTKKNKKNTKRKQGNPPRRLIQSLLSPRSLLSVGSFYSQDEDDFTLQFAFTL
eukprot:gb/GECH01012718.1/.p1 GENE.gb/GECH01012718.1/~~gb/GECH01012718.1/.p1  ORF type:complete len:321 (+),score=83.31 gb/GECH01012718.1/:1-963(+)